MTSLPEVLIRFRTDLEEAIGREQTARVRRGARRRRAAVLVAIVVAAGTASAIASVRDFPFIESAHGRMWRTVDGVRFSVDVPRSGWEARSLYISNNTVPPQSAEVVIFWAGFRDGGEAAPCARLLSAAARGSTADLAVAVAKAPGTKVVKGPSRVTLGGRPAQHVVLTVRKDLGCDPGFFFTWRPVVAGAFWDGTDVGDTIRLWIVDVNGTRLFIEAETKHGAGVVQQEITKIVRSIRFE